jgi:hypothetical protein
MAPLWGVCPGWGARCLSNSVHPPANAPMPGQGNVDSPAEARIGGGKRAPPASKPAHAPSVSSTAPVIAFSPSATTQDQSTIPLVERGCLLGTLCLVTNLRREPLAGQTWAETAHAIQEIETWV